MILAMPVRCDAISEGFVDSVGARLHYQVFGAGPETVLLLPTWSIIHSDFWRHQVAHLATGRRVITFDGRGNGESDRPSAVSAYAVRLFARDALAVLDAVGVERAVAASVSRGACWGLVLAAEHPERISASVFIAPALPFGRLHPAQERAHHAFDEVQERYEGWAKWNRHYWVENWPGFLEFFFSQCFTEPNSRAQIDHFAEMGMETDPRTIIATIEAPGLTESECDSLAASVSTPTLVIHGERDAITPVHRGETLAQLVGAKLVVLRGSGHEPQTRNPATVNRIIDEFLGGLDK
jgi:pimeloyl-ACP methyl ester carboxylesterase